MKPILFTHGLAAQGTWFVVKEIFFVHATRLRLCDTFEAQVAAGTALLLLRSCLVPKLPVLKPCSTAHCTQVLGANDLLNGALEKWQQFSTVDYLQYIGGGGNGSAPANDGGGSGASSVANPFAASAVNPFASAGSGARRHRHCFSMLLRAAMCDDGYGDASCAMQA